MNSKKIVLISTLLLLSIFISACSSSVYASTSWHGLTADANLAYLAAGTQVYAVDLNTGTQKWKFPDKPNAKGFYATPVLTVDGGQLLVPSYDHMLYSLDPNTGVQNKWSAPPNLKNRLIASPLIIDNSIYQPSADGNLYEINLATGTINKTLQISNDPIWAQPTEGVNCGCIYVASMDHSVYSIDLTSLSQKWKSTDLGGSIVGKPAVGPDGTVYIGTFGSQLVALDGSTGRTKWPQPFHSQDWVWAGPALDNNILYFGDLSGNFYAINTSDGSSVSNPIKPNNSIVDTPVVSGNNIYLTTEADTLYTISTAGTIVNTTVVGGVIYTAPVIAGDKILVAPTGFGTTLLVALNLETPNGPQKWAFTPVK
jgi:outer membrane protein assembly factor BamB